MNEGNKGEKLYDLSDLEEISGGSRDFVQQMLQLFIDQSETTITGFKASLENNDLAQIKSLAHQIKPSIDNIKIHPLSKLIREVEGAPEDNLPSSDLEPKINSTIEWLEKVNQQLLREIK
ncbi:Hpt domain-containing protein [Pleomorphovibrio marinus]|uniref:Hpt domain-containing protein n=1 Tax=Pleomorphovibrio marinus TaxID=2164132 RepID=UPI0013007E15|nr:Hpt domain-containing protein [Pleomorphovibrio marinus]